MLNYAIQKLRTLVFFTRYKVIVSSAANTVGGSSSARAGVAAALAVAAIWVIAAVVSVPVFSAKNLAVEKIPPNLVAVTNITKMAFCEEKWPEFKVNAHKNLFNKHFFFTGSVYITTLNCAY